MSYPHDEAEDRVIARALDADDNDTSDTDEAAMDRATLDEYQQVLSYLPFEEMAPPAGLEDRVIAAALERRPATVRSIDRARRRKTARWVTLGAAVAAAAAVIVFMFASTGDTHNTPGGRVNLVGENSDSSAVSAVLKSAGVRKADLVGNGETVGKVALASNGNGVLYQVNVPPPGVNEYYWVWLVTKDKVVPIGTLPNDVATPGYAQNVVPFKVEGDASAVIGVSLSLEKGTTTPSTPTPGATVASGKLH